MAFDRHCHINDPIDDTLWRMIWTTVSSTTCGRERRQSTPRCAAECAPQLLNGTLLHSSTSHPLTISSKSEAHWHVDTEHAHNFNDLRRDLRAYSIVARVSPSGRNHRRLPFLSTSVNFFPDMLSSTVSPHSRTRTSTHGLRRNRTCHRHFVDAIDVSTCIGSTIINDLARLLLAHYFHLEIRKRVETVIHVLVDATFVRTATVATNDAVVSQDTLTRGVYVHCITNPRISHQHSVAVPSKENTSKQWNSRSSRCRVTCIIDTDSFVFVIVFELLHALQTTLGNSLPLAPSDHFRTETAFLLVCDDDQVGLVQVLLPDSITGFHALRADSTALTPFARCAWRALLLFACGWHCSCLSRVLGSQSLAVLLSSRPLWHGFHQTVVTSVAAE